jgi:hypothetical protein
MNAQAKAVKTRLVAQKKKADQAEKVMRAKLRAAVAEAKARLKAVLDEEKAYEGRQAVIAKAVAAYDKKHAKVAAKKAKRKPARKKRVVKAAA